MYYIKPLRDTSPLLPLWTDRRILAIQSFFLNFFLLFPLVCAVRAVLGPRSRDPYSCLICSLHSWAFLRVSFLFTFLLRMQFFSFLLSISSAVNVFCVFTFVCQSLFFLTFTFTFSLSFSFSFTRVTQIDSAHPVWMEAEIDPLLFLWKRCHPSFPTGQLSQLQQC